MFVLCGGLATLAIVGVRGVAKSVEARNATVIVPFRSETRVGDLGITVTSAGVNGFSSTSPGGTILWHEPKLLIHLSVRNYNPNKFHTVRGQALTAVVEDNFGKRLEGIRPQTEFGLTSRAQGQIPPYGAVSVGSADPTPDMLILEIPSATASSLVVTLDAANYGWGGKLRVVILRSDWEPLPQPVTTSARSTIRSGRKN